MNTRAQAAYIVHNVMSHGRSLQNLIPQRGTEQQRALMQELSFGTLRFYYRLKSIAENLLLSPLKPKNQDIFALLLVGLYQLAYTDIPEYATVSETVSAAKALKKPWAAALINKTLRRFISEKEQLYTIADKNLSSRYAHPTWFIKAIQTAWPAQWQHIITANNSRPPMILRVNSQKTTRNDYLLLLKKNNIAANIVADLPHAIKLEKPVPVKQLPKFREGYVYIQDSAGQHAAHLLNLEPHQRVLDACAAPGSKTTHILETEPDLAELIAIDNDSNRIKRIDDNIKRLGLSRQHIKLMTADASNTKQWWDSNYFDRILVDAPCSATGIMRRHPDIKLLRKESDITQQARGQMKLLNALWPLLQQGGLLLYSTCSILPEENELTIHSFLTKHADAQTQAIDVAGSIALKHGRQLLPEENSHDGFYYALLQKTSFRA